MRNKNMDRPRISKLEFQKVRSGLVFHDFSKFQRDKVEEIFRGDLEEEGDWSGIDEHELEKGISWMRANKSKHGFSDNQIDLVEAEMRKYL